MFLLLTLNMYLPIGVVADAFEKTNNSYWNNSYRMLSQRLDEVLEDQMLNLSFKY